MTPIIALLIIVWFWYIIKTSKSKEERMQEARAEKRAKYDEEHPFPLSTVEQFLPDEAKESICEVDEKDFEDDEEDDDWMLYPRQMWPLLDDFWKE